MSFVAVGLQSTPYWPVAGGITPFEINNALILPLAAQAVMGTGGAVAVILMVFMVSSDPPKGASRRADLLRL